MLTRGRYEDITQPWRGPGLAISRSIGDLNAERSGLISMPEVISHDVDVDNDMYLILASDGVWEFLSPAQVHALGTLHTLNPMS